MMIPRATRLPTQIRTLNPTTAQLDPVAGTVVREDGDPTSMNTETVNMSTIMARTRASRRSESVHEGSPVPTPMKRCRRIRNKHRDVIRVHDRHGATTSVGLYDLNADSLAFWSTISARSYRSLTSHEYVSKIALYMVCMVTERHDSPQICHLVVPARRITVSGDGASHWSYDI
jgi:hypothetical protein